MTVAFSVQDMTCGHCVATITDAVKAVDPASHCEFDLAARRVARTLDLKVIGTIGLVAWAKSTGLIRLAAPVLDELCRAGMRVSTPLIDEVLDLVGEPR